MSRVLSLILLLLSSFAVPLIHAAADSIDGTYAFQSSFQQPRYAGMGGAGCALLDGSTAAYINPALPNAFHIYSSTPHFSAAAGYGRDSLNRHCSPFGLCYFLGPYGSLGVLYRYVKSSDQRYEHEGTLNYSGRLFDQNMNQGAVDFGINLRLEHMWWQDSLSAARYFFPHWQVGADTLIAYDTLTVLPPTDIVRTREDRFALDLGFFQKNVAERVDFGLVCHNLLGYQWATSFPGTRLVPAPQDSIDERHILTRDSLVFADSAKNKGWQPAPYRRITVGMAFHTPIWSDKASLVMPADVTFIGLFERSMKTRLTFSVGAEVNFADFCYLRAGYASMPMRVSLNDFLKQGGKINTNILRGGGGFRNSFMAVDVYFGKDEWGMGLGVML
jgi:hypothetical protein